MLSYIRQRINSGNADMQGLLSGHPRRGGQSSSFAQGAGIAGKDSPNDYGDNANALWSLYNQEAENHDKALIETWRSDMEAIIIFAGLYSATLTSFLVDSYKNLQPDPAQETAYYGRQSALSLVLISQQIALNGSQPHITPASFVPPLNFSPSSSDVRVNVYWFMSLVFSLSAALFATIIQQWVRHYMQLFQRYDHALKRARLRQYLFEGVEFSRIAVMVEAVPALIHVSLFLFFMGLGDFLFNLNTTTAIFTIIPVSLCTSIYILGTVGPVMSPQLPFQTPFSGIFWYLVQKLGGRQHHVRGSPTPVSTNMADGRMQLAMDEADGRRERDARAINWLIRNRTEESEIEPLIFSIPGSLNNSWGIMTWHEVARLGNRNGGTPPPGRSRSSRAPDANALRIAAPWSRGGGTGPIRALRGSEQSTLERLCKHVGRLLETCGKPGLFVNAEARSRRARACIQTAASLMVNMNVPSESFGVVKPMEQILAYVGRIERVRDAQFEKADVTFTMHWTCMSLLISRKLPDGGSLAVLSDSFLRALSRALHVEASSAHREAVSKAQLIDNRMESSWNRLEGLCKGLKKDGLIETREQAELALRNRGVNITQWLKDLNAVEGNRTHIDHYPDLASLSDALDHITCGLLSNFPGSSFYKPKEPLSLSQASDALFGNRVLVARQLVPPGPIIETFRAFRLRLHAFVEKNGEEDPLKLVKDLQAVWENFGGEAQFTRQRDMAERQLWRFNDLACGGFGFHVELFFLALQRLLPMESQALPESHQSFYVLTFKAMTLDWGRYRHSPGMRRILLDLLCDTAIRNRSVLSYDYPEWIEGELVSLVRNLFRGLPDGVEGIRELISAALAEVESAKNIFRNHHHKVLAVLKVLHKEAGIAAAAHAKDCLKVEQGEKARGDGTVDNGRMAPSIKSIDEVKVA
ncbi:hypothetical protein BC834DRAFT_413694 [Gloeopeniophorella convolvens]|nr:hypothetical protein BC834DRAFT_413694 [Gloeopeniophorella convolvens]